MEPKARREALASVGVAALPFAVYAAGACRTVYVGDSGDLATAVAVLGIPHPSGYPLYVLAGRLWSRLFFFLPLPWSLSLFSAAAAAAAAGVLYATARRTGVAPVGAVFAAWLLAFAPSVWGEANVQRVYALNALFVALALRFLLAWRASDRDRDLVAAAFVCGLGASNHLEMAVVALGAAAYAGVSRPALLRRPRSVAACVAAAAVGLLPYLYLPIRSSARPLLDWGHPTSLESFAAVVLRESFWGRAWLEKPSDLAVILGDDVRAFARESAWLGLGLAAVAVAAAATRRRDAPVLLPLLVIAGNVGAVALHGSRSDLFIWHRYLIPSFVALALLAAWGWQLVEDRVGRPAAALALAAPALLLLGGWRQNDRSRYRVAEAYSRTLLAPLPPGSRLIATDDNVLFVLMYLNLGAGLRPDVDLVLEGVGGSSLPPLAFNPDVDPVFLTHHPNWTTPMLEAAPVGLVFRAWRAGRPWPEPFSVPDRLDGELDPRVPKDYLTQNLIGNFHEMLGMTWETRDWKRAEAELGEAAAAAPDNDVLFYNLGLIYRRNGLLEPALAAFRRSAEINPRAIVSASHPRAVDRAAEVEAEIQSRDAAIRALAAEPALAGLTAESPAWRREVARLLAARGRPSWARGQTLLAAEAGS